MVSLVRSVALPVAKLAAVLLSLYVAGSVFVWGHLNLLLPIKVLIALLLMLLARICIQRLLASERASLHRTDRKRRYYAPPVRTSRRAVRLLYAPAVLVAVSAVAGLPHEWRSYPWWVASLSLVTAVLLLVAVLFFTTAYDTYEVVSTVEGQAAAQQQLSRVQYRDVITRKLLRKGGDR